VGDDNDDEKMTMRLNNYKNLLPDFNYYRSFADVLDKSVLETK